MKYEGQADALESIIPMEGDVALKALNNEMNLGCRTTINIPFLLV